jgi:hypothetical protein
MHATQATPGLAQSEVPARATAALSQAVGQTSQPLAEVLAERNALVDRANAGLCETDEELDATVDAAFALEATLYRTPSTTADDVVAKVAVLAEFIRETGCPNREDVEVVLADAARVLLRACDPFKTEKIGGADARWSLIPTGAAAVEQRMLAAE